MKKFVLSVLISTVILFLWSGVSQMFPWGVPSTQTVSTQSDNQTESFQAPNLIELPPYSLTTPDFDRQFANKISTLTTDDSFSWIISKPIDSYSMGSYFVKEALTQLVVALILGFILLLTVKLDLKTRLGVVALFGLAAVAAIYGQMMNWWGMPALYALGVGINMIVGWILASWVSARYLIKN